MNISRKQSKFEIECSLDEIVFIHQMFNEVCNGFRVTDFETKIGNIDRVKSEMQRLRSIYLEIHHQPANEPIRIKLDSSQLLLFRNVIDEVCKEIEDWEFQTRTGDTRKRAGEIQAQLQKMLDESPNTGN
jgi:hypothetical protein